MTKEDIKRWEKTYEQINQVNLDIAKWAGHSENIEKEVSEISVIVTGNGHPEDGMVYQFQDLKHQFENCRANGMTQEKIKEAINDAVKQIEDNKKDNGDERRKNAFQRMTPKNKVLVAIAVAGFLFTYAVQIYHVAKGLFDTFITIPN